MIPNKPTISVFMLAYNHEPYIAQSIESIMTQETNLNYELVIGEDCSTDNTKAVIKVYMERYPGKIRLIDNRVNIGMHQNFLNTMFSCHGKYLCLCEGDDYWDNPKKLDLQFNFLEANPEYVLVCGNRKRFLHNENKFEDDPTPAPKDHDIGFEKLIRFNCITTATIMFRNVLKFEDFTNDFYSIISCDWYMYMKLLYHGKFRYLNPVFAVYRANDGSITGRTNRLIIDQKEMKFLELVKVGNLIDLDANKRKYLELSILYRHNELAKAHAQNGDQKMAIKLWWYSFKKRPLTLESVYQLAITFLLIISPSFFQTLRSLKRSV